MSLRVEVHSAAGAGSSSSGNAGVGLGVHGHSQRASRASTLTPAAGDATTNERDSEEKALLGISPDLSHYNSFGTGAGDEIIDIDESDGTVHGHAHRVEDDQLDHIVKLGTLKGVTIPTCEFMWSVIIFIRFGLIVAQAGLVYAIGIMLLAATTVALTVTSISAIATNGVPSGGVLYVLTKSLGSGIGGAIALIYAVGVAIFISVELVGSVQGLLQAGKISVVGSAFADQAIVGGACLLFLSASAYIGTKVVHRLALFFLLAIVVAYISMFAGLLFAPSKVNFDGLVTGFSMDTLKGNLWPEPSFEFREVISLLFPCFVGVYSGVNNAMHLRNPYKAIPWGALGAIAISATLYTSLFLLTGSVIDRKLLLANPTVVPEIALPTPYLTIIGLFLVGQGSALHCCLLCSKVIQTIFAERIIPRMHWFRVDHLSNGEPRNAVILVTLFTLPFIFITELESLASIVSMCFLLCYGFTNFACMLLEVFRSPHWRPVYKHYHWLTSLIGLGLCLMIMLQIQPYAAMGLLALAATGTLLIQLFGSSGIWGHAVHGLLYSLALGHLLAVENEETEALIRKLDVDLVRNESQHLSNAARFLRNNDATSITSSISDSFTATDPTKRNAIWRPQVLAFFGMPEGEIKHPRLLSLISQMSSHGGLCIVSHILATTSGQQQKRGENNHNNNNSDNILVAPASDGVQALGDANMAHVPTEMRILEDERLLHRRLKLKLAMREENVDGFVKVFAANSVRSGQSMLLQTVGLCELTPNTVLVGWPEKGKWEDNLRSVRELRSIWQMARRVGMSVLIAKGASLFPDKNMEMRGTIDIWWIVSDGPLILLIGFILKQHAVWSNCTLRLFALTGLTQNPVDVESELRRYLALLRIEISEITVLQVDMVCNGEDVPETPLEDTLQAGTAVPESVSVPIPNAATRRDLAEQLKHEMELEEGSVGGSDWNDEMAASTVMSNSDGEARTPKARFPRTLLSDVDEEGSGRRRRNSRGQNSLADDEDDSGDDDDELRSEGTGVSGGGQHTRRRRRTRSTSSFGESSPGHSTSSTAVPPRLAGMPTQPVTHVEAMLCSTFVSSKRKSTPFLKQRTAAFIRQEMNRYSKSSALVILNLPAPNFDANIFGLNSLRRSGIYMELMEFITQDIPRSILVHSGGKAKDVLSLYAL
ncbi:hypothetical protein RI367_005502 [Sorochytrium milnesiophthora]